MNIQERQAILDVLNNLPVVESQGGDSAYVIVEANDEAREKLNAVGVTNKIIDKYTEDDNTFCILHMGFSEEYADVCTYGKMICYDCEPLEMNLKNNTASIVIYKLKGEVNVAFSDELNFESIKLSSEQKEQLKTWLV